MTVHHPLASLAILVVAFAGAVGALPIGLYGGGYYPITYPVLPYLGQFGFFYQQPYINLKPYNPFQRYFHVILPDRTSIEIPDIPSPIVNNNKEINWILKIMKWPGWKSVIKDEQTKAKWLKLVNNMSNFTDINNPEWSKQLRQWIANQRNIVQLFSKVYEFMETSPEWEENIKVWLNFTSVSAKYASSFKKWVKSLISGVNTNSPSDLPGTESRFPGFPPTSWQPPTVPWRPLSNVPPDFGFGEYDDPERQTDLFGLDEQPSEPEDPFPPYYPPLCTNYECYPSPLPPPPPPPSSLPNFPPFPRDLPQFQLPQFPIFSNPYLEGPGFDENTFYDEGQGYELPNLNNIRQINKVSA